MQTLRRGSSWCMAAVLLSVATAGPVQGQGASSDSVKTALALRTLQLAKASATFIAAIEAAIPSQRAASPELPADFWEILARRARSGADSLTNLLAPVYVALFTEEELRGLVAFYESPLGQRLATLQPQIVVRSAEIGERWGMLLGVSVVQELVLSGKMQP